MAQPTSPFRTNAVRLAVGVLALVVGAVAVACSADPTVDTGSAASTTVSTAAESTGPTSITQSVRLAEIAGGFDDPTAVVSRPMRNQLWVAERAGRIRVIDIDTAWNLEMGVSVRSGYTTLSGNVLDFSGDVGSSDGGGLRSIAFSTDAHYLFAEYTNRNGDVVIASWSITDPPYVPPTVVVPAPEAPAGGTGSSTTAAPRRTTTTTTQPTTPTTLPAPVVEVGSRRVLLTVPKSEGATPGQVALGRDGYLYIGIGDGSKAGTTGAPAQDPDSLVGKLLRIDPAAGNLVDAYVVPETNPFVDGGGAQPVFTLGVHDPAHFSFDRSTGDLWLGDPGSDRFQEIDLLTAATGGGDGANLGWPLVEGTDLLVQGAAPADAVAPLFTYRYAEGSACDVVGGFVYRGSKMPGLQGVYVYGDRCGGALRGLLQRKGRVIADAGLGASMPPGSLVAFGQDDQGELFVVSSSGAILQMVAA